MKQEGECPARASLKHLYVFISFRSVATPEKDTSVNDVAVGDPGSKKLQGFFTTYIIDFFERILCNR